MKEVRNGLEKLKEQKYTQLKRTRKKVQIFIITHGRRKMSYFLFNEDACS